MAHILIVAPSEDLLRSLQFVLEAEGHRVTARDGLLDPLGIPDDVDSVVLDHHAVQGPIASVEALLRHHAPVILLSNSPDHPLADRCFRTVTKPFLGPFLSQALWHAIRAQNVAGT